MPVEHGLLMENLLDLAHAPFTHTTTFAKGWPVPEAVKFHATKLLTGNWDPYPITMAFQPPCMVLSTIGLAQPGKIERVCWGWWCVGGHVLVHVHLGMYTCNTQYVVVIVVLYCCRYIWCDVHTIYSLSLSLILHNIASPQHRFTTTPLHHNTPPLQGLTAQQCANHLHQLHVCLPSRPGHTRLLYRMSLDFLGWLRYVPGIEQFWKGIAGQVLGEDLVLVKGQQERLLKGGDTWNFPVSYDKLAVRYRRWRNAVGAGEMEGAAAQAAQAMSAGQLFTVEEDEEDVEEWREGEK